MHPVSGLRSRGAPLPILTLWPSPPFRITKQNLHRPLKNGSLLHRKNYHARLIIASAILLSSCAAPRVIELVKVVEVVKPVAAPCPRPEDVRPMPAKPAGELPDDARQAVAVVVSWVVDLVTWGRAVAKQQAACSQVSSDP